MKNKCYSETLILFAGVVIEVIIFLIMICPKFFELLIRALMSKNLFFE